MPGVICVCGGWGRQGDTSPARFEGWGHNIKCPPGRHWPKKGGMGMCGPEDPLFMPLLPLARVPFQAKESVHKTPFWGNLEILASTASIFTQILASQAPKFGNFQLTSPQIWKFSAHKPQIWKFSAHKPPFSEAKCQFASPTLRKSGPHTPTWKKSWVPTRVPHVVWTCVCVPQKSYNYAYKFRLGRGLKLCIFSSPNTKFSCNPPPQKFLWTNNFWQILQVKFLK